MPHQPVPPQIRPRLARLDGLRGLAALGVMLCHIAFYHPVIAALPFRPGPVLGWIATSGWSLVDLFFVLSGYVFAHVYGAPGLLRRPGAAGFWWGQAGSVIVVLLCADAAYRLVEMPARRAIRAAWAGRSWTLPRISFSPRPS